VESSNPAQVRHVGGHDGQELGVRHQRQPGHEQHRVGDVSRIEGRLRDGAGHTGGLATDGQ
jgi:hypothetical protein